jgi:hypothetical protein
MLFIAEPKISGSVADKVFEKLAMAFVNSKWRNRFADAACRIYQGLSLITIQSV